MTTNERSDAKPYESADLDRVETLYAHPVIRDLIATVRSRDADVKYLQSQLDRRIPEIPFPGGSTQADFYRSAADKIERKMEPGGSNVTAAVVKLLRRTAAVLEEEGA